MKMVFISLMTMTVVFLSACAHHRDVRPGADGIHRVVIPTPDQDQGPRQAISQAQHYCESQNKSAAFIEESSNYKGDMPETDYKTGKKITNVAKVVGSAAYVFGGKNESQLGGLIGLGGVAGDAALGNGYKIEMKFKCQ